MSEEKYTVEDVKMIATAVLNDCAVEPSPGQIEAIIKDYEEALKTGDASGFVVRFEEMLG